MQIKVNDKFSVEKYEGGWILTIREPGVSKKTKEPITTEYSIYPATLLQCCERMMEMQAGEAKTLEGIIWEINLFKQEIKDWLKGVEIAGQTFESKRDARGRKGIEAGNTDNQGNDGNEGKRVKGKVQTGNDSKSEQVPVEKKKRTRRKKGGD